MQKELVFKPNKVRQQVTYGSVWIRHWSGKPRERVRLEEAQKLLKELGLEVDQLSDSQPPYWFDYMDSMASLEGRTVAAWFDEAIGLLEAYLNGRSEEVSNEAKQSYERFMNVLYNSAGVQERKQGN